MSGPGSEELDALWARHHAQWRDPAQVATAWEQAGAVDPLLLRARTRGPWWELLDGLGVTLLVTREYEHLVMALSTVDGRPATSFLPLPHPSGLVAAPDRRSVHVASTRNPNQVLELRPAATALERSDAPTPDLAARPLVPVRSTFHPGSLYLHDLAFVGGRLHGNAVGQNAIVRFDDEGGWERVWWPRAIESDDGVPDVARNHLQLNSIAAGDRIETSCFSASVERISARRPGHRNWPVDGRGVVFDGATREPITRGLTRPHSARWSAGDLWVDNSGYGEVGVACEGRFEPVARLGSWTRGLSFCEDVAFVGISRVIPRFRQYAPGLDVDASRCGVVALDRSTGRELARIAWPYGNQIFAVDWLPREVSRGFPFTTRSRRSPRLKHLFYAYETTTRSHR